MIAPSRDDARRGAAGFTLLEVMCAFAILAIVSAFMVVLWTQSLDKAGTAIDRREMREIADSFFSRVLYEDTEHRDGDSGTMDIAYGQWADLPQARRDRYRDYRYVLEKRLVTAAGTTSTDSEAEPLFDTTRDDTSESTSGTTGGTTGDPAEEGEAAGGTNLWRVTLKIFRVDDPQGEESPLITLQTYRRPADTGVNRGAATR
ncbi:MAG: type II secretion system protein [Dehalococcoidia bacterium]